MADQKLLDLKRAAEENKDDLSLRFRFRVEAVRAGQHELAGLEVGDEVVVEEKESPWIKDQWRGTILRVFDAGDKYVRPNVSEQDYRVKPSTEYFAKGLYLTKEDSVVLAVPVAPGKAEEKTAAPAPAKTEASS